MVLRAATLLPVLLQLLLVSTGCRKPSAVELRHRQRAVEYVMLITNYTPADIVSRFEQAEQLLTPSVKESFADAVLAAERQAVLATGRQQEFVVIEEEVSSHAVSESETEVIIPGARTRSTGEEPSSAQLYVTYYLTLREVQGADALSDQVTEIHVVIEPGQVQALSQEALLEQWNAASAAAKEERDNFKEAVSEVQKDLDRHQEKVEQDFQRLINSMDQLGTRVKKLSHGVKELRKRRVKGQAEPISAETEQVEEGNVSSPSLPRDAVPAETSYDAAD